VFVDGSKIDIVRVEDVLDDVQRIFLTAAQAVEFVHDGVADGAVFGAVQQPL
jgi:hypothetical protein